MGHLGAYTALSYLLLRSLRKEGKKPSGIAAAVAMCCAVLYGLLLEMLQGAFFPHRHFEWGDVLANSLGVLIGFFVFKLFTFK